MDHMMPRMDGVEATGIIRDLGYKHPVIALTANALAGQAEMFLKNGFDGVISKPIDIRQLNASLNKLIRDRQSPEALESARRQAAGIKMAKTGDAPPPAADPELAAIFARDAEKALERLEAVHANAYRGPEDIRMFVINVHAMKSALGNIGETELSGAALKLEEAGRAEDIKVMTSKTPGFLEALREVMEKSRPKEDWGEGAGEETEDARAYLGGKLLAIQKACEVYDEINANAALAELGGKKWPRPARVLLDSIAEHLLHSDFEEAAKLARD
jgi:HPt (histidine-containing phosphotransfer) domain-containing protein